MKRKLQLIALTFVATFLFTNLGFAQLVLQKGNGSVPAPTEKEDQWIHYDTGSNENSIGLNGGGLFDVAARWEPAELAAFEGYAITKLRMYISDVPTSTTAKIWQGADVESLDQMLSVFFEAPGDDWVEVELDEPYMIDTSLELWIGYQVDDPGEGVFAAGCDAATDFVGFGNKVKLGTDAWTDLSEFGIAGNWNLQAFVVEMAETNTVVDIIVNSEDHTTLATAVTAAGLVDALSGEGPFTVFAPTNAAFDALPEGLLDALLADPEGDLTKVLLYHVVEGNVLSGDLTDGQVITTLLGQELTVTIDGGVFINDFAGNSVEVTVPDLEADNGVVHVVDGVLIPDLTVSTYSVTFNVDMNDAVAVGDVAFDPEIHSVFLTGTFTDWATPGDEGSVELELVVDTKEEELLYPGNWLNATEIVTGVWTGGGPIFGTNTYGDNAYGQIFEIDQEYTFSGAKFIIGSRIGDAGVAAFTIWDYSGGSVGAVIASKAVDMADITVGTSLDDAFVVMFDGPVTVSGDFVIGVDLTGLNEWADGSYELGNSHSGFGEGAGAGLSLVLEGSTWVPVLDYDVDVDIAVFPMIQTETPEDLIYTATLDIEEGEQEYKYFLVEDAPTWDLGEAEGVNNRVVDITDDVVFNDIWGDIGTFVDNVLFEDGLNLFPNPVSNTLYVENSELINELRIYDLTGRLVFSQVVNDNTTSVNVSEFKTGVYIMQVMTVNGVASSKFNVR